MGCGRMLFGGVLCAMSAFLLIQSAPTSLKASNDELTSHEKPLVRTKRADEMMYGNHQNTPRVKKSDPSENDGQVNGGEATKTDANALPPEENDRKKDDEEQSLPEEKRSDEQEEYASVANEQNDLEEIPLEAADGHQETMRRKRRSALGRATEDLMTAENMASAVALRFPAPSAARAAAGRTLRAKRDLDYEELRELLENSREAAEEEEEEEEEGDDNVPVLPNSEGDEEEEDEEDEGNGREEGALPLIMPYPYDPRVSSEKVELIRELVEKKEEEEAKEKLIDYLLAAAVTDAESAADDDDAGGRFLVDDGDDEGAYVGPVPAAAVKRGAVVYYDPLYSYEPRGSRWGGALMSGSKRSRLSEYERLNRLAEALGAYNDYEEEEEK